MINEKAIKSMQPEPVPERVKIVTTMLNEVEISRSFSRKIQKEQFEPIEVFASVKALAAGGADLNAISENLNAWVVDQVERDLEKYNKPKEGDIPF